jgi:FG-GAP-like repeat
LWLTAATVAALTGAGAFALLRPAPDREPGPTPVTPALSEAELARRVQAFCGACHASPRPESFPRRAWRDQVLNMFSFFRNANLKATPPPVDQVIKYFEDRAPPELPPAVIHRARTPLPVKLERLGLPGPPGGARVLISHLSVVHLSDKARPELLATDMGSGRVMALRPWAEKPSWRILAQLGHPAHAEVGDLDGDKVNDLLVADLGSFGPTDRRCGSVVWLRGNPDGSFTPFTLLKDVGRVADVQAADFNGDGKLDLIVAAFGWQDTGQIILLENRTKDWKEPVFVPRVLDYRHGAIHVPVWDLDGDGKPDFVALLAQEHEAVVAFLNEGDFRFRPRTLFTAGDPSYGSSGIQLVDLNGDGKVDVLYTNGDTLDAPHLLKPYHGVQWLENRTTDWSDPQFVRHPIGAMYGVHRAVAVNLRGRGLPDVLAVSYLPPEAFPQRQELKPDAVVLFEQTAPGQFARHTLQDTSCDHVTCAVGDLFGSGRPDLITATFQRFPASEAVTIWKNLGPRPGK